MSALSVSDGVDQLTRLLAGLTIAMLLAAGVGGFVLPPAQSAPAQGFHALGAPARPVRLVVPSLKIDAPVLPIQVTPAGALDPPRNPHDVGWWDASAKPGAHGGQTVLTGHTVHTGGGVMDRLGKLAAGKRVQIHTPRGTLVYSVTRVITYSKAELAKHAVDLFAQKRHPNRLVLITCTGWTGHDYTSNIVAFARPLGVRDRAPVKKA
jgi:LPXTG-site transpeptidase (sortase) family protein